MSGRNRLYNAGNPAQGSFKKVLTVCSAGLLRSPTAALVLSQEPFNYNTRSAGVIADYALIVVDDVLATWADEIVCMTKEHERELKKKLEKWKITKPVYCLNIPDNFSYRDAELMSIIKTNYEKATQK